MLKIFKRDLYLCAAITAFVMFCALAWGGPFLGNNSQNGTVFAKTRHAPAMIFQGSVLRQGEQFLLRDASGVVFHLDDLKQAPAFIGKSVTITGHLETASQTIHIERIEPAA